MRYKWKYGVGEGVVASEAAKVIDGIAKRNKGAVKPKAIVEAARPKDAVMHNCFEWNNTRAATAYREDQARHVLRSLVCVYTETDNKGEEITVSLRAFHSNPSEGNSYVSLKRIADEDELFNEIVQQAFNELDAFRQKYKNLKRLREVMFVIETVLSTR